MATVRETLELIITRHALDRLNDADRFPQSPHLPLNEEIRFFHLRRTDTKESVWMAQVQGGFLVGERRITKRRQMLVAMTAINFEMFRRDRHVRLGCYRVTVDKISIQ
jgi:hypothetical protein